MKSYQRRNAIWSAGQPTPTEKLILLALEDFCGDKADCFPSQATLTRMTGYNTKTIQRGLRSLENKGLVITTPRYSPNGGQTSNNYAIQFSKLGDIPPEQPPAPPAPPATAKYPEVTTPRPTTPPTLKAQPPKPIQEKPLKRTNSDPELAEVGFSSEAFQEQAQGLDVDLSDRTLSHTMQANPGQIAAAFDCLAKAKNVLCPTRFLTAAIAKGWRSRASRIDGPRTKVAPVGFGEWFTEAKRRGIAIASEMRDSEIQVFTSAGEWRPFEEMAQQPWPS